ncbi:Dienelactone hydrolase family [Alloactinosynnema sp. L-07]|uniref:dienelactone hydrolase family protein n=1 Tax=Alloactinosynnema sp. L-07 TaxID=1653480 RepID=UPI00065F032A|nr:dienelactone hydrolase family protein [Alloactinosynnema sp. L-07]CRK57850.1 Dienelactone hydrolase family [Alloactinosynnema sp. L-07]
MCHGDQSHPPAPPGAAGAVADEAELRLTSADGTRFLAYQAVPERPTGRGVVLLPDVRGLHRFYRDLARRFAEAGVTAVALDYYGRTADVDERGPDFDGFAHVVRLRPEQTGADVTAAVDHLLSLGVAAPFTVGFCVGGAISWAQSALESRLAGAVGFYGRPSECADLVPSMRAPVLVLAAGADMLTSEDEARAFKATLALAGVPYEFHLYADAPHSFFDGALPDQAANAADAWDRVLGFLDREGAA